MLLLLRKNAVTIRIANGTNAIMAYMLVIGGKSSDVESGKEIQFQVMVEFWVIMNVTEVIDPFSGTDPVPIQPVQVQIVAFSVTGLETYAVTD